jgi:hypothetical protein
VHGYADDRAPDDGQIHHGIGFSDAAPVLAGDHVQAEVQARFNAPVLSVGLEHLLGIEVGGRTGTDQILGFDFLSWFLGTIDAAG